MLTNKSKCVTYPPNPLSVKGAYLFDRDNRDNRGDGDNRAPYEIPYNPYNPHAPHNPYQKKSGKHSALHSQFSTQDPLLERYIEGVNLDKVGTYISLVGGNLYV